MSNRTDAGHPAFRTTWIHAFEEDTPAGEIYRPEGDDIPLSRRPRRRLALMPDGSARVWIPGPNDRPAERHGRWEQAGDELLLRVPSEGGAEQVLHISVQSPSRLLVRK
jgi:hypothetical protein